MGEKEVIQALAKALTGYMHGHPCCDNQFAPGVVPICPTLTAAREALDKALHYSLIGRGPSAMPPPEEPVKPSGPGLEAKQDCEFAR